ncbi:hypothetical protein UlMin_038962 [Ulmus minor]
MASSAHLRLMSDLKAIINEPPEGCSASPLSDDNIFVWSATIFGPDETPWEGGVFSLRLTFGENYLEKPPRVRFTSEMFHPNVYLDGTICMDIIQDAWSPCQNVSTILSSVQSLLTDPNPASPANPEAAEFYQHDIQAYNMYVNMLMNRNSFFAIMFSLKLNRVSTFEICRRVRCCARSSIESL